MQNNQKKKEQGTIAGQANQRYNGRGPIVLDITEQSFGSEDKALEYLATVLVEAYIKQKTT